MGGEEGCKEYSIKEGSARMEAREEGKRGVKISVQYTRPLIKEMRCCSLFNTRAGGGHGVGDGRCSSSLISFSLLFSSLRFSPFPSFSPLPWPLFRLEPPSGTAMASASFSVAAISMCIVEKGLECGRRREAEKRMDKQIGWNSRKHKNRHKYS